MIDDESIRIKQESDDDDYSVYSDDERKPPARPSQVPTTIESKQEDVLSEDDMKTAVTRVLDGQVESKMRVTMFTRPCLK